jgi:hypothetical protein
MSYPAADDLDRIHWHCPVCNDNGVISGWHGHALGRVCGERRGTLEKAPNRSADGLQCRNRFGKFLDIVAKLRFGRFFQGWCRTRSVSGGAGRPGLEEQSQPNADG